jgi:hypothetical protein
MRSSITRRLLALILTACALPATAAAHDIPRDVTVQAFARPEGQRLRLLIRVPLKAIMDVEFPRRPGDYVDLARVEPSLRDAARLWLASKIELFEDDVPLTTMRRGSGWRARSSSTKMTSG